MSPENVISVVLGASSRRRRSEGRRGKREGSKRGGGDRIGDRVFAPHS